jgi:chromosome segregation ATPase
MLEQKLFDMAEQVELRDATVMALHDQGQSKDSVYKDKITKLEAVMSTSERAVSNLEKTFNKKISSLNSQLDLKTRQLEEAEAALANSRSADFAGGTSSVPMAGQQSGDLQSLVDLKNKKIAMLEMELQNKDSLIQQFDGGDQSGATQSLVEDLARTKAKLSAEKDRAAKQIMSLKSALSAKDSKIKSLEAMVQDKTAMGRSTPSVNVDASNDGRVAAQVKSLKKALIEKERALVAATKTVRDLKMISGSSRSAKADNALIAENKDLRSRLLSYEQDLASLTSASGDTSKLQAKIQQQDAQIMELTQKQAEETSFDMQQLRAELAQARQGTDTVRAAHEKQQDVINMMRKQAQEKDQKIAMLESEMSTMGVKLSSASNDNDLEMNTLKSDLQSARLALKNQRGQYQALIADLQNKLSVKDREIALLETTSSSTAASLNNMAPAAGGDSFDGGTLNSLQKEIALLKAENDVMRKTIEDGVDTIEISEALSTLNQLRTLQVKYDVLNKDYNKTKSDLVALEKSREQERLSVAGENWDLQSVTRRYNEAERQLRTMGSRVEKVRSQCMLEKQDLEGKLFDPRAAKKEQIARLVQLEEQLSRSEAEWAREKAAYEEKLASLGVPGLPYEGRAIISKSKKTSAGVGVPDKVDMASLNDVASSLAAMAPAAGTPRAPVMAGTQQPVSKAFGVLDEAMLSSMLQSINVYPNKGIRKVSDKSDQSVVSYRWDYGRLFGSAEQRKTSGKSEFEELTNKYLRKIQKRCGGDFAAVPVLDKDMGRNRVMSYDVACVGKKASASASVVFYNQDGFFTSIAHEAGVNDMNAAMDLRDRIVKSLVK